MAAHPQPLSSLDSARLDPGRTAFFLDFDGTLADIAARPDAVSVPAATRAALARLAERTGGALAIVSGRAIADIDRFLAPLVLPVAGVHGLERRDGRGAVTEAPINAETLGAVHAALTDFTETHAGTVLERKAGSLALHYRRRPDCAETAAAAVHAAVDGLSGLQILHGKMVIEVKTGTATKGDAVAAFMAEPPFRGRRPLFAGDDVTDEDGFRAVAGRDGISIKVGDGETAAGFRSAGTEDFRRWLGRLADDFAAPGSGAASF